MSSDGPYGRHGFNANAGGYGGASYSSQAGAGGGGGGGGAGYMAPSYGQGYGGGAGSYGDAPPGSGGYAGYGQGAPMEYNQVRSFFFPRGVWESGDWVGSLAGNFLIVSLLRVICTVSYGVHLSCRK